MVTLRQLSYFAALARARHFGRAAEAMHVSQPALSVQIRELEASLGGPLVERLPRDVRLTPRGRAVLARAAAILDGVAELEAEARRGALTGQIHLGIIPTVAPYVLPAMLADLGARSLRLREAQTEVLLAELEEGRIDAAMVASAPPPGLAARALFDEAFVLVGTAPRLARLDPEGLRPTDIDPDQLLLLDEGHCLADQALEVCGLSRRRPAVDLGAASLQTLCALVAADQGVTLLPETSLAAELRPGLALRRFGAPEPGRRIRLVARPAAAEEPWFAELAQAVAGRGAGLVAAARGCAGAAPC